MTKKEFTIRHLKENLEQVSGKKVILKEDEVKKKRQIPQVLVFSGYYGGGYQSSDDYLEITINLLKTVPKRKLAKSIEEGEDLDEFGIEYDYLLADACDDYNGKIGIGHEVSDSICVVAKNLEILTKGLCEEMEISDSFQNYVLETLKLNLKGTDKPIIIDERQDDEKDF